MPTAEYARQWRAKNPDLYKQHQKASDERRRANDPLYFVKKIYRERKRVALNRGLPFSITLDDIKDVPNTCPVLGIPMVSGAGNNNPNSATLDRLVPEKGYVPDNVCWISRKANRIKCDASLEELQQVLAWVNGKLSSS